MRSLSTSLFFRFFFFLSSRRRHTRFKCDWSSDVCSSVLVVVIGAGHAGCEAALAAARMGCRTLLLTMSLDAIGQMSCNPAVGGTAKGHLVREIDALGGEMGRNTDRAAIQFKTLNTSRGPAVRSSRAQCDRARYRGVMKHTVETQA